MAVPLWSQNYQQPPLHHRVGTLHAQGGDCTHVMNPIPKETVA
jgi:hypothetical protein